MRTHRLRSPFYSASVRGLFGLISPSSVRGDGRARDPRRSRAHRGQTCNLVRALRHRASGSRPSLDERLLNERMLVVRRRLDGGSGPRCSRARRAQGPGPTSRSCISPSENGPGPRERQAMSRDMSLPPPLPARWSGSVGQIAWPPAGHRAEPKRLYMGERDPPRS